MHDYNMTKRERIRVRTYFRMHDIDTLRYTRNRGI
jgi:hypothetical protein